MENDPGFTLWLPLPTGLFNPAACWSQLAPAFESQSKLCGICELVDNTLET